MEAKVLFIVFISIFTITAVITLLGITNLIKGIREKYLTPLFTALILEVVAAVVLLFKNQDFSDHNIIPEIIYQECSLKQSESSDKDCYKIIQMINDRKKLDSLIFIKDHEIKLLKTKITELSPDTLKDFYYYIQQIERIRLSSKGIINLKSNTEQTDEAIDIIEQILLLNGRLTKDINSKEEVIAAYAKFKQENNRDNKLYKIYLQDVPLFVKEYLIENYELKFYISNPDIPASLISKVETPNNLN
ncbi:hypothetical protein [Plebeiibacterium sediminum]|uniref:Uncharacterized protein n=1 Tax=Plebeiibacterium sediminum TaxID=2992112 RepID=A0AAE3M2Q3_9BACT|nr:hypothetical protein [Plebeiobacterium sediminum]MCW3786004.1 hypothetical protein [Plebeiobacterium sediminum]